MKTYLPIFIFFISTLSFSQKFGDEKFDAVNFKDWETKNVSDYKGAYSFGFSESESELRIFTADSLICAQLTRYEWNENPIGWKPTYENFKDVKIIGNKFYSKKSNGTFVIFKTENGQSVGLIIEKPWGEWIDSNQTEFGQRFPYKEPYLVGNYPECSQKNLNYNTINKFDLEKLKVMRNEIFARYGYKFKKNGEMDKYFRELDWYTPFYDNADSFLTQIEKNNIGLIKKIERIKNGL